MFLGRPKIGRDFPFEPSGPSAETRKPTTRGCFAAEMTRARCGSTGQMDFQPTSRRIPIAVLPVTAPRPRHFDLRVVPAPADTNRSASRKVTKTHILPSSATTGEVDPLQNNRQGAFSFPRPASCDAHCTMRRFRVGSCCRRPFVFDDAANPEWVNAVKR